MLPGLNVEEIKRYNESLRAHKERSAKLKAEIEFNTAELNRICNELSAELGIQVTAANLEQIYNERVEKINNTLETGKEILRRIAEEERAASTPVVNAQPPQITPQMPSAPAQPVFTQGAAPVFSNLNGGNDNFTTNPFTEI